MFKKKKMMNKMKIKLSKVFKARDEFASFFLDFFNPKHKPMFENILLKDGPVPR